jgi:hypothetical protein
MNLFPLQVINTCSSDTHTLKLCQFKKAISPEMLVLQHAAKNGLASWLVYIGIFWRDNKQNKCSGKASPAQ